VPEDNRFLNLPTRLRRQMLRHVRRALPEEACGFLAGIQNNVLAVLPVSNRLHSPVRFEMEPLEQLRALQWMEQHDLEILAIFHSHPAGPATPSRSDVAEHSYPDSFCVICSPSKARWHSRGFKMLPENFEELSITNGVKKVETGE
jgi:proteasome lid subunit RPN8/RPN11